MTPTFWENLYAVVVGLLLPIVGALQARGGASGDDAERPSTQEKVVLYRANAALWLVLAGLAVLVWTEAGRSLAGLGLTAPPERPAAGLALAALFLMLYAADTWRQVGTQERLAATRKRWRREVPFMPTDGREIRHSLTMVAAAAVFEEIVYRGFLVGYFVLLLGDTTPALVGAVCLPALIFAVCHLYQSAWSVMKIGILSALFGGIFVVTGSLWIPIALHFIVDLVATLMAPWLLREEQSLSLP